MSNLVSLADRTEEEKREIAQKGGIASGKARKRQADILKALKALLESDFDDLTEDGETHTGAEAFALKMFSLAVKEGNVPAMREVLNRLYGKSTEIIQAAITEAEDGEDEPKTSLIEELSRVLAKAKAPMLTAEQILATPPGALPDLTPEQVFVLAATRFGEREMKAPSFNGEDKP